MKTSAFRLLALLPFLFTGTVDAKDLETSRKAFAAELAEIRKTHADRRQRLDAGYLRSLKDLQQKIQGKGDLDGLLAINKELKQFESGSDRKAGSGSTHGEVAALQNKYAEARTKIDAENTSRHAAAHRSHLDALAKLQADLTRQRKIPEAVAVRDEIRKLQKSATATRTVPRAGATASPARGMPNDYTLYYAFDQRETDKRVLDRSPNALHGETNRNPWIEGGIRGGGFDFTTRDRIKLKSIALVQPDAFTIAAWVKLKKKSSHGRLWDKYEHFGKSGYTVNFNNFKPALEIWGNKSKRTYFGAASALPAEEWHHIAVTYAPGKGVIYIDGEIDRERELPETYIRNQSPVRIGYDEGRPLRGHVDELLFYPRALSAEEIRQIITETGPPQ